MYNLPFFGLLFKSLGKNVLLVIDAVKYVYYKAMQHVFY